MPANRLRSIKRPRVYEGLRRRGVATTRAAQIANAGRSGNARRGRRRRGQRR